MYGKVYYPPEHYIPKSLLEKTPCLNKEAVRLHANNANMTAEESELEFLKVMHTLSLCIHVSIRVLSFINHRIYKVIESQQIFLFLCLKNL